MTWPLLLPLFIVWLLVVAFLRYYRVWLPYYVLGAVGLAYWISLGAGDILHLEPILAQSVAAATHVIAGACDIPTRIFDGAPGVLLVLVIAQEVGWTVLHIGVESSGLLEISVFISLVLFYPGLSLYRRGSTIVLGTAATWIVNVIRLFIIVVILNRFGKTSLVLAHNYVGKIVFFVFTIAIYWYLITAATVRELQNEAL